MMMDDSVHYSHVVFIHSQQLFSITASILTAKL